MEISRMTRVMTSLGPGYIDAQVVDKTDTPTGYLVVFHRTDYSEEEWLKIAPKNGPCRFVAFDFDEVTFPGETEVEVLPAARVADEIEVGQRFSSNRGNHAVYRVSQIKGEEVLIEEVKNRSNRWWTTKKSLRSRYTLV